MGNNTISCEVVKDLIPLYSEGLCSEDSTAAVKNHIAGCESCRKLLELPVEQERINTVPEKKNVLRKLNKRMKLNKAGIIILAVLLLLVIGATGFLCVGQFVKGDGMISFETIAQSAEAKQLASLLAKQDFRGYVDSIYDGGLQSMTDTDEYEKIQQHNADMLSEAFRNAVGDRKVNSISAHSEYSRWDEPNRYLIYTWCTLTYNDGAALEIAFIKNSDNRFTGDIAAVSGIDNEKGIALGNCFSLINNMNGIDDSMKRILERLLVNDEIERRASFISHFFAKEYWDDIADAFAEFLGMGYKISSCTLGEDMYDDSFNRYFDLWLTAQDESGSAVLCTRIYRGVDGLIKPDKTDVYRNGCSDELAQSLSRLFG